MRVMEGAMEAKGFPESLVNEIVEEALEWVVKRVVKGFSGSDGTVDDNLEVDDGVEETVSAREDDAVVDVTKTDGLSCCCCDVVRISTTGAGRELLTVLTKEAEGEDVGIKEEDIVDTETELTGGIATLEEEAVTSDDDTLEESDSEDEERADEEEVTVTGNEGEVEIVTTDEF